MGLQSGHKSFGEQARHYFFREQQSIPETILESPAAWKRKDIEKRISEWEFTLSQKEIEQLHRATEAAIKNGSGLEAIRPGNFILGDIKTRIASWRKQIQTGVGFVVIKGLPIDGWSEEEITTCYWGLGHHLGIPGAQNPQQELLGHVKDYGETSDDPYVRLYRTSANIDFHCDAADAVGLLCLEKAKKGGQSLIVSTVTLFNELFNNKPELVPYLFKPFKLDARGEHAADSKPYNEIPIASYSNGKLQTFYHSEYFRSVERLDEVILSKQEKAILDFYDATAAKPDIHLSMDLEKGDMQFISNHTIAHSRTAYENIPEKPRHLLRLWLSFAERT